MSNTTSVPIEEKMLRLADQIGGCTKTLTDIIRGYEAGRDCILAEREALEALEDHGPEVIRALRVIAMRFNRAAIGSHEVQPF